MPPELVTGLTITFLLVLLALFLPRRRRRRLGVGHYALDVLAVAALIFVMLRYQAMVSDAIHSIP